MTTERSEQRHSRRRKSSAGTPQAEVIRWNISDSEGRPVASTVGLSGIELRISSKASRGAGRINVVTTPVEFRLKHYHLLPDKKATGSYCNFVRVGSIERVDRNPKDD